MPRQIDHSVVGVIVEHEGKILLVQEGKPGREGLYNVPGGHVDEHETLLETAVRETKEESGYDVELTGLLGVYQSVLAHINVSGPVFSAKVVGGDVVTSDEHPEVRWVSLDELHSLYENKQLFTTYPPHAAELLLAGKVLPLDAVICNKVG